MRPSLIAIAICAASFSLPSITYAQGGMEPPAFPEIHLADMPAVITHGTVYNICGTVTGIQDGTAVSITVHNMWLNFPVTSGDYTIKVTVIVSGGAFCTNETFTFYGAGSYSVDAEFSIATDNETGSVAAP